MVAVSARDLVVLFAGLEITSLSLLARNGLGRAPAARTALGLAVPWAAATGLTLMGIACMWAGAGAPDWDLLARDMGPRSPGLTVTGGALLLAGLAVRAGVAPFHFWVPQVAAGCDRSAALLTAATAVAPALVITGRLAEALAAARPDLGALLLGAAILTVTAGNLLALPGRRLERLLGYGVVIHAGYALAAAAAPPGPSSALWLQLAVLILAVAGGLAVSGLVAPGETADGLARRAPLPGAALCVCLIALAGLPPTAAFAARAALFSGLAEPPSAASALLLANSLLTAAVFLRFAARVAFGRAPAGAGRSLDAGSLSVAVLSAALLLLAGLWPAPLARAAEAASLAAGPG